MRPPESGNSRKLYRAGSRRCAASATTSARLRSTTKVSRRTRIAPTRAWLIAANVGARSLASLARNSFTSSLSVRAAASICLRAASYGSLKLRSTATRESVGTASFSSSSCLPASSSASRVSPVMFPPGRARLVTTPSRNGSGSVDITIGIVRVAWHLLTLQRRPDPRRRDVLPAGAAEDEALPFDVPQVSHSPTKRVEIWRRCGCRARPHPPYSGDSGHLLLLSASAFLNSALTDGHASALHRVWSITRRTRLMRSHGWQRRASVSLTSSSVRAGPRCRGGSGRRGFSSP